MVAKHAIVCITVVALSFCDKAFGRERWLERRNRAILLHPRRFDQEHPAVIDRLSAACDGSVCGSLAGQAITPLLAAQGECTQQDMADTIIDASKQFDNATQINMIAIAQEYRQAEKNTPPDFSVNPPANRNSVFCQQAPKYSELNGLVQAQDPANDPNLFFDPATQTTVQKGSQANTFPFSGATNVTSTSSSMSSVSQITVSARDVLAATQSTCTNCPSAVTVSVSGTIAPSLSSAVTVTGGPTSITSTSLSSSASPSSTGVPSSPVGDFGSCSVPQIAFGAGFDGRKETSFEPADQTSYGHGSSQDIDVITQFICNSLANKCGADQSAQATCTAASSAADEQAAGTGAQADAFNAAFGITTQFASVSQLDNQGNTVTETSSATSLVAASTAPALINTLVLASPINTATAAAPAITAGGSVGNFGSCSVPEIQFATGFDGRKETSFEPVDKTSYNHDSAQDIDIITQFICNTLTNSCGADQTANNTCAQATTAADAQTPKTGAQADAFNAAFGIQTNFAAVSEVDDQGNIVSSGTTPENGGTVPTVTSTSNNAPSSTSTSGNLQTFIGNLGGITAPAVTDLGNGQFQVAGNSVFNSQQNAISRSCDVQQNDCANAANASGNQGDLTVAACGQQQSECDAAATSGAAR